MDRKMNEYLYPISLDESSEGISIIKSTNFPTIFGVKLYEIMKDIRLNTIQLNAHYYFLIPIQHGS